VAKLTALSSLGRTAVDAAVAAGVARDVLLARAGIATELIDDQDARLPVVDLLRLWAIAAELSNDPFFGLHAGERVVSARTIHVVGFAARSGATLGDALDHAVRFASLINEGTEMATHKERGEVMFVIGPKPGLPAWPRAYSEMAIAAWLSLSRTYTGVAIQPVGIAFQHPKPASVGEYERLFDCPVRFNAPTNRLALRPQTLELPNRANDSEMAAYFVDRAQALLANVAGTPLVQRVREAVADLLGREQPTLERVARRIATSPRTLQRRLADDKIQFGDLVDDVRKIVALQLVDAAMEMTGVAARVGYRDLGAFRAAFQRWTGMTPRQYRTRSR
jgi:AraC-like DNA-binding protein